MRESAKEPTSLLHDFIAQQHANVFMRAFSFATNQLPIISEKQPELADRVMLLDNIGFIFQLREREQKVASKAGDIEKWVSGQVVRKGVRRIQSTRDLLAGYVSLSVVNHFGHRLTISTKDAQSFVGILIYRVPPKTRAFRAARFKQNRNGGFVHILRDTDYFEICHHFVTPAELLDYFNFRRDILLSWDPPATAVSEAALIGQYLLEDFASPPSSSLERAARSRGGPTACEFSFVLDSLGAEIAALEEEPEGEHDEDGGPSTDDRYEILSEIGLLGRYELRALKHQLRLALEAVRANRFELPFRMASRTGCGFLTVPIMREFQERAFDALESLSIASKHELDLEKQVGIGMWKNTEFVDIEWIFLKGKNVPYPQLDERLSQSYPFRRASERRLPPIFT
ncbi:MAG TPA: hypothetical protein VGJ47_00580 [Gemmatimonadaceae bacterium]